MFPDYEQWKIEHRNGREHHKDLSTSLFPKFLQGNIIFGGFIKKHYLCR